MTVETSQVKPDPLDALRVALLDDARKDAAATLADADAAAAATLAEAQAEADAIRAEARTRSAADRAAVLSAAQARAAREARRLVLAERRVAYDALREQAREAVCGLRHDPSYPALRDALRERALRVLGPDAIIEEHERGGIVGLGRGRRVDYTLEALADSIVELLGDDLEELWAP